MRLPVHQIEEVGDLNIGKLTDWLKKQHGKAMKSTEVAKVKQETFLVDGTPDALPYSGPSERVSLCILGDLLGERCNSGAEI